MDSGLPTEPRALSLEVCPDSGCGCSGILVRGICQFHKAGWLAGPARVDGCLDASRSRTGVRHAPILNAVVSQPPARQVPRQDSHARHAAGRVSGTPSSHCVVQSRRDNGALQKWARLAMSVTANVTSSHSAVYLAREVVHRCTSPPVDIAPEFGRTTRVSPYKLLLLELLRLPNLGLFQRLLRLYV